MTSMEASQHTAEHTLQELRSQVAALTDKLNTTAQETAIQQAQWSERVEEYTLQIEEYTQQINDLQNEVSTRQTENEALETEVKLVAGLFRPMLLWRGKN